MKRKLFVVMVTIALLLSGCALVKTRYYPASYDTLLGLDGRNAVVLEGMDSHGGFHGDGASYEKLLFSEAPEFPEPWRELPMDEDFQKLLWGETRGAQVYGGVLESMNLQIPIPQEGKWYFYDRHSQSTDPNDVKAVFDRHSLNFTAAVWDAGTMILYVIEFDT